MPDRRSRPSRAREITTVEGLGSPEHLAPLQAGVHAPLRRAVRLLHRRDDHGRAGATSTHGGTDDREAIQEALGGHVCRCTGYVKIVDAVAAVARGDSFDMTVTAESHDTTNVGGAQ